MLALTAWASWAGQIGRSHFHPERQVTLVSEGLIRGISTRSCDRAGAPASAIGDRDPTSGPCTSTLTDTAAAALTQELHDTVESDRYPFSPRIRTLSAILGNLKPEPARPAASAPPRHFEPPSKGIYRRRR
jgi:hypothetical protein